MSTGQRSPATSLVIFAYLLADTRLWAEYLGVLNDVLLYRRMKACAASLMHCSNNVIAAASQRVQFCRRAMNENETMALNVPLVRFTTRGPAEVSSDAVIHSFKSFYCNRADFCHSRSITAKCAETSRLEGCWDLKI